VLTCQALEMQRSISKCSMKADALAKRGAALPRAPPQNSPVLNIGDVRFAVSSLVSGLPTLGLVSKLVTKDQKQQNRNEFYQSRQGEQFSEAAAAGGKGINFKLSYNNPLDRSPRKSYRRNMLHRVLLEQLCIGPRRAAIDPESEEAQNYEGNCVFCFERHHVPIRETAKHLFCECPEAVLYSGATFTQIQHYLRRKYRAFKAEKLNNWLVPSAEVHSLNIGACGAYGLFPNALPKALQAAGVPEKSCEKAAANIVAYVQNRCLDRYKVKYPISNPVTARILREAAAARAAPPVPAPAPHSPVPGISPPPSPSSPAPAISYNPKRPLSPSPPPSQASRSSFGRRLRPNTRYLSPQRPKRTSPPAVTQPLKRPRRSPVPSRPPRLVPPPSPPPVLEPVSPMLLRPNKRQLPQNEVLDEDNRDIPPRPLHPPRLG
jgi:hypothetical protein